MSIFGVIAAFFALGLTVVAATAWWSRRLWRRWNELSAPMKAGAVLVAASLAASASIDVLGLTRASSMLGENGDPSQQARLLAEGISEAINCAALAGVVWLPGAIVLSVLVRKPKTASR